MALLRCHLRRHGLGASVTLTIVHHGVGGAKVGCQGGCGVREELDQGKRHSSGAGISKASPVDLHDGSNILYAYATDVPLDGA